MGDIAIDVFLETLKNLITNSNYLDLDIYEKNKLQYLADELNYLGGFLKITVEKRINHPEVMDLVMQIRDVVYEAENEVGRYVALVFKANHASDPLLEHKGLSLDLKFVRKRIRTLMIEVKQICEENMYDQKLVAVKELKQHSSRERAGFQRRQRDRRSAANTKKRKEEQRIEANKEEEPGSLGRRKLSKVVEANVVVGFKKEIEILTRKLHDSGEGGQLEIISIIGPVGAGKTTLAREVYDQRLTSEMFEIRAWITVSYAYDSMRKKDLLIGILKSALPGNHEDYNYCQDDQLVIKLLRCLKDKKYLIVMEDIWDLKAWNDIQMSLCRGRNGSKVMFIGERAIVHTEYSIPSINMRYVNGSQELFIGERAIVHTDDSIHSINHYVNPLTESCSWELLEKKVFGKKRCPLELVEIGKQIALKCGGLPLSIITIAGILASKDKTLDVWQEISNNLSSITSIPNDCMVILRYSYDHLPLHLKACFLYIGAYPDGHPINVRELTWLWIAEGFIQKSEGDESMETIAEGYLIDLIDRNLVMVTEKNKYSGEIKTCYVHKLLRDLCMLKAREDEFFVQLFDGRSIASRRVFDVSRLFIGRYLWAMPSFPERTRNLRSFACFAMASEILSIPEQNISLSFFSENWKLLKVLKFISAGSLEEIGLGDLVHLRYLAIQLEDGYVESCFHFLPNLETFILRNNGADFSLPRHIFKMVKLRHLYSNRGPFHFHNVSYDENTGNTLDSLQTLVPACSCPRCLRFLERTPNLKQLSLVNRELDPSDDLMLPYLECLKCLEKLTVRGSFQEDQINRVATTKLKLPLTLTWLTLIKTNLKWEEVSKILQKMSSLETLQLLNDACKGPDWNTSGLEETFSRLKFLELSSLDIKKWNASADQFPILEVLVIKYCANLEGIPIEFADRQELREIKVKMGSHYVMKSARKIWIKQRNIKGDDDCLNLIFDDGNGHASNVDGGDEEHDDDDGDDGKRRMMMTEISCKMQCKLMLMMMEERRRR